MEPLSKKLKTTHLASTECSHPSDHLINHFLPSNSITSNIFKYLSAKDLLNLSKVSRSWFTLSRDYLHSHRNELQCLLVFDRVDGFEALNRLIDLMDAVIVGRSHPFTGVHLKFTNPIDGFFRSGTGPNKRVAWISLAAEYDNYDYTDDYEPLYVWIERQEEEARASSKAQAKLNGTLKRIFAKIPSMKHVHIEVDYGTNRDFEPEQFRRFTQLLPLHEIEYFRTNIGISEFIRHLCPGQMSNLKTFHVDGLIHAAKSTVDYVFSVCPSLESWSSPVPGNMVASFGPKSSLIKNLIITKMVKPGDFIQIRVANLALTTLITTTRGFPTRKDVYESIVGIIRDNRTTLQTIQTSDAFLKHIVKADLMPIHSVRRIIIPGNCSKATKTKALVTFPNAIFTLRWK